LSQVVRIEDVETPNQSEVNCVVRGEVFLARRIIFPEIVPYRYLD
jgi:hypothetical protein